ncbi:MAG TPA: isochorismate synthase [Gemmatimonadales bacterium]
MIRSETEHIVAAATSDCALRPTAFLRRAAVCPRGFWSHAGRWSAYAGRCDALRGAAGPARFAIARDAARRLLEHVDAPADHPVAPRLHGGFRFGGSGAPRAEWAAFGHGSLLLPALELTSGPAGPWLTGRFRARDDDDDALAAARDRMAAFVAADEPPGPRAIAARVRADAPSRDQWDRAVRTVLAEIDRGAFDKFVLARTLDIVAESAIDPLDVLERLIEQNPASTIFYHEPVPGTVLLGAAPEVIVTLHGRDFVTTAVAGSVRRGATDEEDRTLARHLLESEKDRHEHAIGVRDTVDRVRPFTESIEVEPEPHVLRLARIHHLETRIAARVASGHHVLDLLGAVHPTAAVSGSPRDAVLAFMPSVETFDRGWYAGPIGWCDANGDGVFAPALRSAIVTDQRWRLYAGAGIVAGSDPALEWAETALKFEPMLRAIGAVTE